jgi:hypothetical protein
LISARYFLRQSDDSRYLTGLKLGALLSFLINLFLQELITQHRAELASSLKAEQDRTLAAQKCCDELTAQVQLLSAQLSDSLALGSHFEIDFIHLSLVSDRDYVTADAEHVARLAAARAQFDAEIAFMRSQVSVVCEALPAMDEELNAYKGSGDGAIALMARHNSALKQQVHFDCIAYSDFVCGSLYFNF